MDFNADPFRIFHEDRALLTAGTPEHFNTMTIGWGGLGTLWGKPAATVYVKPVRYTYGFMEQSEYFTVSFYPEKYENEIMLFGTLSGRDRDKVKETGFTPRFLDNAVTYEEAKVTLLCKKIYRQDMDPGAMPDDVVKFFYATEAPHTMYIGEVTDIIR